MRRLKLFEGTAELIPEVVISSFSAFATAGAICSGGVEVETKRQQYSCAIEGLMNLETDCGRVESTQRGASRYDKAREARDLTRRGRVWRAKIDGWTRATNSAAREAMDRREGEDRSGEEDGRGGR